MTNKNKKEIIAISCIIILAIAFLIAIFLPLANLSGDVNEIAIIQINGKLNYNSNENTSLESIESGIKEANNNHNVKAIVFEINSNGGSLVACEEITKLIRNSKKPTVSWISDKATSYPYLIATGTDTIVATHTSAIGGLGISFTNSTKYSKATVTETVSSNNRSFYTNSQNMINQDYIHFIKEIGKNRKLSQKYLININQGIVNGNQGLKIHLIDKIGDKDSAINIAASKANLTEYKVSNYPKDNSMSLTEILNTNLNQDIQKIGNSIFK